MTLSIQEPRQDNELFMVHSCHLAKNGEQELIKILKLLLETMLKWRTN